jgi:hypothetical protein
MHIQSVYAVKHYSITDLYDDMYKYVILKCNYWLVLQISGGCITKYGFPDQNKLKLRIEFELGNSVNACLQCCIAHLDK